MSSPSLQPSLKAGTEPVQNVVVAQQTFVEKTNELSEEQSLHVNSIVQMTNLSSLVIQVTQNATLCLSFFTCKLGIMIHYLSYNISLRIKLSVETLGND